MSLSFSRRLAVAFGVLAPLGETIRRWHTWGEWPPNFFDDYLMGALLLYAAWVAGRDPARARRHLAAAWGFACGLGYASFFAHLRQAIRDPTAPDPAPIPHVWVTALIGVGWVMCLAALITTLRNPAERPD